MDINERIKMLKKKKRVKECKEWYDHPHKQMMGCVYFLAFIGTAVYYIQQSDTFWMGVLGFFKALIWPAMLIYKVFTLLNM